MQFPKPLRTPIAAAALSALFPGLGQAAAGKPSRGAIVAVPALAVLGALGLILLFDRSSVFNGAFNQAWLTSLLLVDLVALVYHLWAIADSYLLASQAQQPRRRTAPPSTQKWSAVLGVGLIVSGTFVAHGFVASVDMGWQNSLSCISALTPCFADAPSPGQSISMTEDPVVEITDSPDPGGSATPVSGSATPHVSFDPNATFDPNALPSMQTSDQAKNWSSDGQLNVLLAGVDSGAGGSRSSGLRPDTMIVLHVDIASGKAAMIGVPRNTMCVPLPQGVAQHYSKSANGCPAYTYPNMLNWLANDAGWNHPSYFPFDQSSTSAYTRAMLATEQAIGTLTGLTIDGFVVINLDGLVSLIDDLGGININVPKLVADYPCGPKGTWQGKFRVCDLNPGAAAGSSSKVHNGYSVPQMDPAVVRHMQADAANSGGLQVITWSQDSNIAFTVKPGQQHMDGDWALAYARTRIYSSDYDRMLRQQLVLKAMRNTFNPCTVLPQIPGLVDSLGTAFWTDLPLSDASRWAGLAKAILGGNVKSITLDPTTTGSGSTMINPTSWNTVKNLVAHSLDGVPAGGSGGSGGGGFSC